MLFRKSLEHKKGFYNSYSLEVLHQIIGKDNYFVSAEITASPFKPQAFLEKQALQGEYGKKRKSKRKYINLSTLDPIEHYNFLRDISSL